MAGNILLNPINDVLDTYRKRFNKNIKVTGSQLGDYSGAVGALSLVYKFMNNGKTITL